MVESLAPGQVRKTAENLLVLGAPAHPSRQASPMVRHALAAVLAALLAQVTFGAVFEQLASANVWTSTPSVPPAPNATAEALARAAPTSLPPPLLDPAHGAMPRGALAPSLVPSVAPSPSTPLLGLGPSACPSDMVLVEGEYCTDVLQTCARWLDDPSQPFARCAEYQQPSRCIGQRVRQRFCMDRYEYTPPGEQLPLNYASFVKANTVCDGLGKRVCTEGEWNFACEGEDMRPYPYGFTRSDKCNQDRSDLYEPNPHRQILADRRERADARPECVSPFGVFNMAGNMDEPVLREGSAHIEPNRNALKGGWWMPARNRCRPATTAHDDYYQDIQVGVRCCAGANSPS